MSDFADFSFDEINEKNVKTNSSNNICANVFTSSVLSDISESNKSSIVSEITGISTLITDDSPSKVSRSIELNNVFEIDKKSLNGYEINRNLKENKSKSLTDFLPSSSSWKNLMIKEKPNVLSVTNPVPITNDVYADPVFGLRLTNPVVSSQFIKRKMEDKLSISVAKLSTHLRTGDKNCDWVFAGVIVFKTGLKTSQKGKQYCLWKISDLKLDLKQATVYLFGHASSELWKVSLGTVVGILNASPFNKDENIKVNEEVTLMVRSADQVMIWGSSKDYAICKGIKVNGDKCTAFVNKNQCEFCIYHVKSEYNKFTNKRADLQASFSNSHANLRNKILGKNEVFYGGRSYTAVKPSVPNSKLIQRDKNILNNLSFDVDPKIVHSNSLKLAEKDNKRLETLATPKPSIISNNVETCKPKEILEVCSRLNLIKAAGQKMIETGKSVRLSKVGPEKKQPYISFASVFSTDVTESMENSTSITVSVLSDETERNTIGSGLAVNKRTEYFEKSLKKDLQSKTQNFSASQPKEKILDLKKSFTSINAKKIDVPSSFKESKIENSRRLLEKKQSDCSSSKSRKESRTVYTVEQSLSTNCNELIVKKSLNEQNNNSKKCNLKINKSPILNNSSLPLNNFELDIVDDNGKSIQKSTFNMLMSQSPMQQKHEISIHRRKADVAKMNAINMIKQKGGLLKVDPNRVKSSNTKRKSVKRILESDDEGKNESTSKSVLSSRFMELMNTTSKYEHLVDLEENKAQQEYFSRLEKKEQLEEKMLTTFKVPCKAVICLKCNYKWFSASDLCKAEGHPIKIIDTVKRFFKCLNCSNRTVTLEIIPLISCKNCGSSNWGRAPMIREKCVKSHVLSIRGDEEKFINSSANTANLDLLIP